MLVSRNLDLRETQKSFGAIALFLVENGADIHQNNAKDQSPIDLCPDPHLHKALFKTYEDALRGCGGSGGNGKKPDPYRPPHLKFQPIATSSTTSLLGQRLRSKSAKRLDGRDGGSVLGEASAAGGRGKDSPNDAAAAAAAAVGTSTESAGEVRRLQQQLFDLKRRMTCPVCLDRLKAMVFLCGHGTCQLCGDELKTCPICRKIVQKKILLYN